MVVLNIEVLVVNLAAIISQKNILILKIIETVNRNASNVHGTQTSIALKIPKLYLLPLLSIHTTMSYFLKVKISHQNTDVYLIMPLKKSDSLLNMEIYQSLPNENY